MGDLLKSLGVPKMHGFVEFTKMSPRIRVFKKSHKSRVAKNHFVTMLEVEETLFGLDLKAHEHCIMRFQAKG